MPQNSLFSLGFNHLMDRSSPNCWRSRSSPNCWRSWRDFLSFKKLILIIFVSVPFAFMQEHCSGFAFELPLSVQVKTDHLPHGMRVPVGGFC